MMASRPLRIAFASPVYVPCVGGGELMLQNVAERLVERGHQATVVCWNASSHDQMFDGTGGSLPERDQHNGVQIWRVPPTFRFDRELKWWLSKRGGWRTASMVLGERGLWVLGPPNGLKLIPPLMKLDADVLVAVNWGSPVAVAVDVAARVRRLPAVGVPLLHVGQPWAERPWYAPLLGRSSSILTLTSAEAELAQKMGARNTEVVGAGVEPRDFQSPDGLAIRREHGLGDAPVVGYVGSHYRGKGVPTLLDAMRLVWDTHPEARLLLAGQSKHRDQESRKKLAEVMARHGSRVVLIDDFPESQRADIFAACDLLALPSVEESFGLVYVEAWVCGTPVIGCRIPAVERVIDHERDGLLVEPRSATDLAAAVRRLLDAPEDRKRMGERGRSKVLSTYTWDLVTDRWEQALSRVATTERRHG